MSWWDFWRRRPSDDEDFAVPHQRGFERPLSIFMEPPPATSGILSGPASSYASPSAAPGGSFSVGAPIGGPTFAAQPGTGTEAVPTFTGGVGDVGPSGP